MTRPKPQPRPSKQSLLIQYTILLHEHQDPAAAEVRAFIDRHADATAFVQRAKKIDALFLWRGALSETDIDRVTATEQKTILDVPNHMAEKYIDACFQYGPDGKAALAVRGEFANHEHAALFLKLADAVDDLKRAVSKDTGKSSSGPSAAR